MRRHLCCGLLAGSLICALLAAGSDRDFSGNWILVYDRSDTRALGAGLADVVTVKQDARALHCSSETNGAAMAWSYDLGGKESRYRMGGYDYNSVVKWEGAALLVNTLVSGTSRYTLMDRWQLSADRSLLVITRQAVRANGETDQKLVYRRAGTVAPLPVRTSAAQAPAQPPAVLAPRPVPSTAPDSYTVPAGTHILLRLLNPLNTKKSQEGDRVYLQTAVPLAVNNRMVIPRGSDVAGTIVAAKPAKGSGKGELYIRFDSLTLPSGVSRDLRSRPNGAEEGKVASAGDAGGDARRAAQGGAVGAGVGGLAGAAAGHPVTGLGIGAAAGVAAGLGGLFGKKPEPILPAGTTLEMVLDRDLVFTREELRQ
ncbi:MAG TPA: hypothetical protein VEG84_02585 [Thermoanaerobaculia bacterium]|nr:hypothetical protein [Thermoanaerobaculia bacterium]